MSLSEKVQQLNREIGSTFERAVADMRQEVSQWLRTSSDELLGRLAELRPPVPESFVAHEDLEPAVRTEAQGLAEGLSSQARRGGVSELREALGAIDRARSQAEILTALLEEAGRYSSRAAILLLRGGEVRGWSGKGFEAEVRDLNLGAPGDGSWNHVFQGAGPARLSAAECATLCSRLDSPVPREGVVVPLVLRDRVAAALYADSTDGPLTLDGLQVLCYTAALAIESLPFRERSSTATLVPVGPAEPEPESAPEMETAALEDTEPTQPWMPPAPATEEEPEPPAADDLPASAGWESPGATTSDVEVEALAEPLAEPYTEPYTEPYAEPYAEPEPAETAAPWAAVEEPQAAYELESADSVSDDTAAEPAAGWGTTAIQEATAEESATPTQKVDLRGISTAPEPEPEPEPVPVASSPEATVLLQRSSLREAITPPAPMPAPVEERELPPPTPIRPVPPPAPPAPPAPSAEEVSPPASATPEVRPPSDLQGPGWAFSGQRVPVAASDDGLHEEARRLARLLVSEIKLYNEEQVEEGRRKRDIYERLREDIDRSRQMYEERVEARILKTTDYFYQELVRILAAGDAKALGI